MIDSTYVNAADPNSMRDLGQTRNAEYTWGVFKHQNSANSDFKRLPSNKKDNGVYSFGSTQKRQNIELSAEKPNRRVVH